MIAQREASPTVGRTFDFDQTFLALASSDARGVPLAGRAAEIEALRRIGTRDASLGRIFEGHLNGGQLVARCGTCEQRTVTQRAIAAGHVFGVWNTQDDADPLRIEPRGNALVLSGAKTWASGAGSITRPVVTAAWPDGGVQMCLLRMDEIETEVDPSRWHPLGMHDSDSFRVSFDGVTLTPSDLIGKPGDYEQQPWFFAGALRFSAVQTGIAERIVAETVTYLGARGRDGDAFQRARVAEMTIAARTANLWLNAGAAAWCAFDAEPSERNSAEVLDVVDMARTSVERAALEIIEKAIRSVGASGLVEPQPFAALVRDLQMYLRQPAPDAALIRIGRAAFSAVGRAPSSRP